MTRATIDFGIDLGTTNSEIALLNGTQVQVFRNVKGEEYTPSAVWVDTQKKVVVGRRAKDQHEQDPANAFIEFKRVMGSGDVFVPRNDPSRRFRPEDLSAEVLKSLRADVQRAIREEVRAAVITIPAAFEEPQCAATRRAAQAAGFEVSPLLQEPIAAALAYGFQSDAEKAYWLVYDFGGGTFDTSLIQLREGALQVVNHGGDNHLGGKDIDWRIVDELLVPAFLAAHRLPDFRRDAERWRRAFARLKGAAEEAKIYLSQDASAQVTLDVPDADGRTYPFDYTIERSAIERLMEPLIARSIDICRRVLQEKRLPSGDVERLLLVGGPTMTPYLRQRLADPRAGLGIPLEFGVDPLTVVARGAAVFAGAQRLDAPADAPVVAGALALDLEYKPVGAEREPLVGGRVRDPAGGDVARHTIEFVNEEARPAWRSGRLALSRDGAFMTQVWAEPGRKNVFRIEVVDGKGTLCKTSPDHLSYVVGNEAGAPPLPHGIVVALADNRVEVVLRKGVALPAKHTIHDLRTNMLVQKGSASDAIRIPIREGDHARADRNREIGEWVLSGERFRRDVPAGTEVEITIHVDMSRQIRATAYVPMLDEEFETVMTLEKPRPDPVALAATLAAAANRLEESRRRAETTGEADAKQRIGRIEQGRSVEEIRESLAAAATDVDAGNKASNRLEDLNAAIDEVESALEWPVQVQAAEKEIGVERSILDDPTCKATAEDREKFATLEREARAAMAARDGDVLTIKVRELDRLGFDIVSRSPGFWVTVFERLVNDEEKMTDRTQARAWIDQGRRAINAGNVDALRAAIGNLSGLLRTLPAGVPTGVLQRLVR